MHIISILLGIILLFLVFRYNNKNATQSADTIPAADNNQVRSTNISHMAYLSRGKLFYRAADGTITQIHSTHVEQIIARMEQNKKIHGWKENTSWDTNFAGNQQPKERNDTVTIDFASAEFNQQNNKLIYFLRDDSFGGLFEYDLKEKTELRLLHKQNFSLSDLSYDPKKNKLLCCSDFANGIANIALMDPDGSNYGELTAGDSFDSAPCWVDDEQVVYQSQGHARNTAGFVLGFGPASLQLMNIKTADVTPVIEDDNYDFMQPQVCSNGDLYYIRRPYQAVKVEAGNALLDTLLLPFRLLRAVFHYLNFFSLMYSAKPLTSASGPKNQADAKVILLKGKRIDAERALQKEARVNGVPSLVPSSWQLICRNKQGQQTLLTTNVASFSIGDNDAIIYTNGCGIFTLDGQGNSSVLHKDKVIETVII